MRKQNDEFADKEDLKGTREEEQGRNLPWNVQDEKIKWAWIKINTQIENVWAQ